jgi:hypothetical protein
MWTTCIFGRTGCTWVCDQMVTVAHRHDLHYRTRLRVGPFHHPVDSAGEAKVVATQLDLRPVGSQVDPQYPVRLVDGCARPGRRRRTRAVPRPRPGWPRPPGTGNW